MTLLAKAAALFFSIALFSGCATKTSTLIMAEVNPPESVAGRMDAFFADEVKRLTKGKIQVEVNASGILGEETSVIREMKTTKKIDLARISFFSLDEEEAGNTAVLGIPYIFNNREHFWKFADSKIADEILQSQNNSSSEIRGLFIAEEGFRHFFSTKPVNSIEDLSGLRIRTNNSESVTALINDLGSQPVQVNFSDIVKEMIVGSVDAAEQPLVNYRANLFDSAAPYVILDGHSIGVIEVIITDKAWKKLSSEQQAALLTAGKNAAKYCREICEKSEATVIEELKASGVLITEVIDKTPWQEVCAETIQQQAAKNPELYNKIIELGKQD